MIPFWKQKTLARMSHKEWESLCDGCGKCCLFKLENQSDGDVFYTDVACRLLNIKTCRCSDYANRTKKVRDCLKLTPTDVEKFRWLPSTCAYRLVHEGKDLPGWHPLISGDSDSVHKAGISIRDRAVSENRRRRLEEHIVIWPA